MERSKSMICLILIKTASELDFLKRALETRIRRRGIGCSADAGFVLELRLTDCLGADSFRITSRPQRLFIEGGSVSALVCGTGKILHEAEYTANGMILNVKDGVFTPLKSFRGIYFATHFHNWYHVAPENEVAEYIIDLAFWGYNTFVFWYDLHHFESFECAESIAFRRRLIHFAETARLFGMKTAAIKVVNEAVESSPEELRAVRKDPRGGWYDSQVCPSSEAGLRYLLKQNETVCRNFFADLHLSYITFWPYDQGGCDCEKCTPWATNGFLWLVAAMKDQIRQILPTTHTILSTWFFTQVEMAQLAEMLRKDPAFCDYVICGGNTFAEPVPGVREIDFPEISMNMLPWGAYGANPQPQRFQTEWDARKARSDGGFPYSEGFFEDVNKVVFSQFYCWDSPANETLKKYASYEFGSAHSDEIADLILRIEQMHRLVPRSYPVADRKAASADVIAQTRALFDFAKQIDVQLDENVQKQPRWRILFLRTQMAFQYAESGGNVTSATDDAAAELIRLYHAENAHYTLRPVLSADADIEWYLF